jgi:hypothetical protein
MVGGEGEMNMEALLNATDVRKDWGHFIDTVVRVGPQFVKRNRDTLVAVGTEHLKVLLASYRFTLEIEQEKDGSFSGSVGVLDVTANAPSVEALKIELATELVEYAREYADEFALYVNAPNRRDHAPYVMNILIQDDPEAVANLIDA